jgi:glycosyltransferase involved in cell wall biosynthesis
MPFFSIVIPTYNLADKISEAIQSVLNQNFTDYEILVIDDGSTDSTKDVVNQFHDERIYYEWNVNSGGPAKPRNIGIEKSNSEWICFLDADDIWYSDKLQVCYSAIKSNIDFIYHNLKINGNNGFLTRTKTRGRLLKNNILIDLLVNSNAIATSSVVVRKKILQQVGGMNESVELFATEDYNTWLKIAKIPGNFFYIPMVLGEYFLGTNNISNKNMSPFIKSASQEFIGCLNSCQMKRYLSWIDYIRGRYMYLNNNYFEAKTSLIMAFKEGATEVKIKSIFMLFHIYLLKIYLYLKRVVSNYLSPQNL